MLKARSIIKIIAIILLVSTILRFCFVVMHLNHNCNHNDNCPICTLVHRFKDDLNGFDPNLIKIIIDILVVFLSLSSHLSNKFIDKKKDTLIGLKVELLS